MFKTLTTAFIGGAALLVSMAPSAFAQDVRACFPIATLKISYQVVFPNSQQITMTGGRARAYLAAFNSFGKQTRFDGDTVLLNVLPNGTTLLVPLAEGKGCNRVVVGPKLHKIIMSKIARSAV